MQIDHTTADVIVVDERHRLPIGRPYVTVAIDEATKCVPGFVVTLEASSATSVGLCLAHMAIDKRAWLERIGVEAVWPMSGKPHRLYVDNASEFKSEALFRGCEQHGIGVDYRPPGAPHYGGIVERLVGTMMRMVHDLPGAPHLDICRPLLNLRAYSIARENSEPDADRFRPELRCPPFTRDSITSPRR